MEQGNVSWAYSTFLGYTKTEKGIEIVPEEAEIVRQIYKMFLVEGKSCNEIAKYLNENKVPTPSKRGKMWRTLNIISILKNEKYSGDAILQKTFIPDYLTHKPKVNNGELKKWHVEDNHPAIINKEEWNKVQLELKKRQDMKGGYSASSIFASKLICADCGSFYGKKVWHSNSPHRKEIYQCNSKFKDKNAKCKTPHLSEEKIKDKFIIAFNKLFEVKDEIIENCHQIKNLLTDVSEEEKQIEEANIEIDIVSELVKKLINDNSNKAQDQEKYQKRYNELLSRYEKAKKLLENCEERKQSKTTKGIVIEDFIKTLKETNSSQALWSDSIWLTSIDKCIINDDKTIEFYFKNGSKIKV